MFRARVLGGAVLASALAAGLAMATAPSYSAAPATPAGSARAAAAVQEQQDLADQIRALPGVSSVTEAVAPAGYRFFKITFTQPVDHKRPELGTFDQRLTLLHKDASRPMVMYTGGYYVSQNPSRSEPTRIVDGNQLSMEYRFFEPSRPGNPDWPRELTIRQAAFDQHRVIESFKQLYEANWITTGGSKGGMTATYHRRFFPRDVDGTVPYVAPNDVDNDDDAYNGFLANVGDPACRAALTAVQRRILGPDRDWFLERTRQAAEANGITWEILGSLDRAMEVAVVDIYFTFWQYTPQSQCVNVPGPEAANEEVWDWTQGVVPLTGYMDQDLLSFLPYYYQASYQLGWYEPYERPLRRELRYPGAFAAPHFVPDDLQPIHFDTQAMRDIDWWVRARSTRMLYVYGGNDPWGAEQFECGNARVLDRECSVHVVAGGTHGSNIAQLPAAERDQVTLQILDWAGLSASDAAVRQVRETGKPDFRPALDRRPAMSHRWGF